MARLPISGEEILALLRAEAAHAAENAGDEQHTSFWLVVADQFQKRGIPCPEATRKALDIIDSAADLNMLAALGMAAGLLRKRAAVLQELRARLVANGAARPRKVIKSPQTLIMRPGDVFAYPTSGGAPYNPYVTPALKQRSAYDWMADAWGALLILKAELACGYLAWYCPLVTRTELLQKPTLESLRNEPWTKQHPGTCSASHFKRLALERLGSVSIRESVIKELACSTEEGVRAALLDISLANCMDVASSRPKANIYIQGQLNAQPAVDARWLFAPVNTHHETAENGRTEGG